MFKSVRSFNWAMCGVGILVLSLQFHSHVQAQAQAELISRPKPKPTQTPTPESAPAATRAAAPTVAREIPFNPPRPRKVKEKSAKSQPAAPATRAVPAPAAAPSTSAGPITSKPPAKIDYAVLVNRARQLYERRQYAEARRIYESVPSYAPGYLRTREELAWTYLLGENWPKLRGIVRDLNTQLVPLRWRLEGRVLSAMLYLRDCQYEQVRREMNSFQTEMYPLAQRVDRKVAAGGPHVSYWEALNNEIAEAVFKMKFVRMELRSRLMMLGRSQAVLSPKNNFANGKPQKLASQQQYPVNGDMWSDELFIKAGDGNSTCISLHKARVLQ